MLKRGRGTLAMAALVGALALMALPTAPAAADHTFCIPGSGPGQCQEARGVAVDQETGQVYVADSGKDLIQVFDEDGVLQGTIGGGTLENPQAVAIDNDPTSPTQGEITVIDATFRVLRFDPAGALRLGFGWGVRDGTAAAQTCGPDASPPIVSCLTGLQGEGECQLNAAIGEGSKVAIGPGGTAYVADSAKDGSAGFKGRVEVFAPDGSCAEERLVFEKAGGKYLNAIAVDSEAGVYVSINVNPPSGQVVLKLDSAGKAVCAIDLGVYTPALAVDPASDRLYAAQDGPGVRTGIRHSMLTIYEPGCAGEEVDYARRYGYGEFEAGGGPVVGTGVLPGALDPSRAGEVALSQSKHVFHLDEPPPGPLLVPGSLIADPVSNTKATLGAEVNPEGKASEIEIEYVEKATCEADEAGGGECFDSAQTSGASALAGEGFSLVGEEAKFGCLDPLSEVGHPGQNAYQAGECLEPETTYRFRAAASNPDGSGNSPVDGGEFTTRPWLELGPAWSSSVGTGSARLNAEVNPLGVPVSGHFQIVPEATCLADEASAEADPPAHCFDHAESTATLDFGKGEELTTRGISLGGLEPGTAYRYRPILTNPLIGAPAIGEARSFTTFEAPPVDPCPENAAFRTGPGALLPDCRGYEMVSPLDKDQADISVLFNLLTGAQAVLEQSSTSGSRLAYGSLHAFGDASSAPWTSQYIAERHPRGEPGEGWSTHSINLPIGRPIYNDGPSQVGTHLQALSPDLCEAWMRSITEPPLAPGAQAGLPNLYVRTDELCGGPSLEALTSRKWENLEEADQPTLGLETQGVSADQQTAAFAAPDSLEGSGAPNLGGGKLQLYVWQRGGAPVFACIKPGGALIAGACSAGFGPPDVHGAYVGLFPRLQGALSASGERLFLTEGQSAGKIYMRERPVLGRKPGNECGPGKPCTIAVSGQGETQSGTSASQFQAAAADGSAAIYTTGTDLYRAEIGETAGHPVLSATKKIAGGVIGMTGVSEDASHVYFASTEAIAAAGSDGLGETAKAGGRNLYLYEEGSYDFIGMLSAEDLKADLSAVKDLPFANLARVSGTHAAFVSSASLTGYDNADVASGKPDTEVFLYDAVADELHCASCNPSGARPAGRDNSITSPPADRIMLFGPEWIAGWFAGHESNLYASRELSADGQRLFFNSTDALVARDTNGRADVYQWEAPGKGSCSVKSPSYSPRNGGCIDLITSGLSARDSEFVDASPSGEDVFFATLSNLVAADYDLIDIYDARVGGGFPPPPTPPVECEGEACQSPPPTPEPPAPASSDYPASDDVSAPDKRRCPKGKHRVQRAGKKARCVKKSKREQRRQNRRRGGAPR